jgi:hypothetical protein
MYTQLGSSQKMEKNYTWNFFSFIAGVVDTAEQHLFAVISANFRTKSKRSQWHTQGPGGHWFTKKTWGRKSRVRLPFKNHRVEAFFDILCTFILLVCCRQYNPPPPQMSQWNLPPCFFSYSFFSLQIACTVCCRLYILSIMQDGSRVGHKHLTVKKGVIFHSLRSPPLSPSPHSPHPFPHHSPLSPHPFPPLPFSPFSPFWTLKLNSPPPTSLCTLYLF